MEAETCRAVVADIKAPNFNAGVSWPAKSDALNGSLPFSEDSEKGVLCSLLLDPERSESVCADLEASAFYALAHQIIYRAICEVLSRRKMNGRIDFVELKELIKSQGNLDEIGGADVLSSLYNFVPSAGNAAFYVSRIKETQFFRQTILASKEIVKSCHDPKAEVESVSHQIVKLEELKCKTSTNSWEEIKVADLVAFKRAEDPNAVFGNRWLCRGDSLLISGSTGIGKSVFAMQMLIHWALGRPFFGIKTKKSQRILCIQSENNVGDLAISFQDVCDYLGVNREEEVSLNEQIIFVRECEKTGQAFIRLVRKLIRKHQPTVILVDPLLSYVGGNINDQQLMSQFLRNEIQPILKKTGIIWVFIHHIGKPPW